MQTADNLEAPPTTKLFEAWLSHQWGGKDRSAVLRAGLIDLNSQFDSVDPSDLFFNSSHGIGPDLSRSGRNGPSIYPVTAPGATITLATGRHWACRLGVFAGVALDPSRPRAFLAERLSGGVLANTQADYLPTENVRVEVGSWRYSAKVLGPAERLATANGVYSSIEAPVPLAPRLTGWVRLGTANAGTQAVQTYLGLGAVQKGPFKSRGDDRLGIAVAHVVLGREAVMSAGPNAARSETSVEMNYQYRLSDRAAVQPDVQWIIHPAGVAGAPNALAFGLRLVFATGFPRKAVAADPTDPTVTPDGAPAAAPADEPPAS